VFHPHNWIKAEQIVELIDYAIAKHGRKVKFLTFREAIDRLNDNMLAGQSLRSGDGQDNGVRIFDVNGDGFMDSVIGNDAMQQTQLWLPSRSSWRKGTFPVRLVERHEQNGSTLDAGVRFGIFQRDGSPSLIVQNETTSGVWHFESTRYPIWIRNQASIANLEVDGELVMSARDGRDRGMRLRDVDGGGQCELVVSNEKQQAIFHWDAKRRDFEHRWSYGLPAGTTLVDVHGRDSGLRFIDVNQDGRDDVVFSNEREFSIHLFTSIADGWSHRAVAGKRPSDQRIEIPAIVRSGLNNGFFVHARHLFWQNEDTAKLKDLLDRRSFDELLAEEQPRAKTPQESLKSIRARPGFEVELVAAEPLVMDPIAFAWGPDGKFWVVEMGDYPLGVDGKGKHGGRVRFLEDTDGNGRYDKSTVFLDELGYPTGVMPWRKGVLVTCAPEIFYAEDTDDDGKADKKEVLFTGFAQGNQQHRVNGLVWGLDGWVYGANGDSGGMVTSAKTGEKVNIGGRDFRFRPDTGEIDPVTGQTQFGRARDDWDNWFGCNNSNPMYQFVLPDHYIRRNPHMPAPDPRVNVSVVPGASPVFPISRTLERFNDPNTANRFTSACSAIVYRDDLFGPAFEGNSFVSEPVHNLIHHEVMSPKKGTGVVSPARAVPANRTQSAVPKRLPSPFSETVTFESRRATEEQTSEFLASSDNWFRPTMIQTGPDGALWIADMYRLVIEHPEWIPKEWQERLDLRAGHNMGRIYRVVPVGTKPRTIPRMDMLDTAGLVAALDSPSGWQRDMAHMMLLWRNDESAGTGLERLVETCERPAARLHAICALDGLGGLREPVLLRALIDAHPGVRRHAVRLAESRLDDSPALAEAVLRLTADPDAHVRMQVAFSLGEWSDARAGRALGQIALRDSGDAFITGAVASSATRHAAEILAAVSGPREPVANGNAGPPTELIERLVGQIAAQDDAAALGRSLAAITRLPKNGKPEAWQVAAVAGVMDALDRRGKPLAELAKGGDAEMKSAVARLAELVRSSRAIAADTAAATPDRVAAVRLVGRGPDQSPSDLETIAALFSPQTPGELQDAAVAAAARLRDPHVPERLLDGWPSHGPRVRSAVLDTLLGRDPWWVTLLDRIESGRVPTSEIDAVHRQRMLDHKSSVVRDRAAGLFGRPSDESRQRIIGEYAGVPKLAADRERGAAVFKKTCAPCHRIGDAGHEIGPDLGAMANRSPEFFLAAILDPNRAVETRYLSYIAATTDGRILTGMLAAETGNSVTLVAQEGKRETLLRTDIESLQSTGKSLMPDGMERDIPPQAMADLFAFLHSAGPPRKSFAGNQPEVVKPELLRHELYLLATTAEIYGSTLVFEDKYKNLGYWSSENDHAVWNFEVDRPGKYAVMLDYACDDSTAGNAYVLEVGDAQITGTVAGTGNWDTYKQLRIGTLMFAAGQHRLIIRSAGKPTGAMIDLRGIRITPFKGP
jgi:putative membrane-bound dehydrogenase-like protein